MKGNLILTTLQFCGEDEEDKMVKQKLEDEKKRVTYRLNTNVSLYVFSVE